MRLASLAVTGALLLAVPAWADKRVDDAVAKANEQLQKGKPEEALKTLQKLVSQAPGSESNLALARLERRIGKLDDARAAAQTAVGLAKSPAEKSQSLAGLAQLDLLVGTGQDALAHAEQAVAAEASAAALAAQAMAKVRMGDPAAAVEAADKAVAAGASLAVAHEAQGAARLAAGHATEAAEAYRKAFALDPTLTSARAGLADALRMEGKAAEAVAEAKAATESDPRCAEGFVALALALVAQNPQNWNDAIGNAQQAATVLNPKSPVVKTAVARLFESQNVTAARQNYQEALALDPGYVPARVGLVRMLDREGKMDLALAEARKVAAESPGSGEAHSVLGGLLLRTRDFAEAARVLEIAGRLLPEDASVQAWLGTAYNSTDRRPEAAAAFGKAVQLAPANTDYRATWGLLLGTQGQYDEAIAQLKKVIDTPGYKGEAAWANLGFVYRTMKRNDEAIAAYQKATEVSPKSGQAWHGLARSLFNATRMDEAMAAYTKTMEFEPKLAGEAHLGLGWCYVFKDDLEQAKASLARAQEAHADPRKVAQLKANIDQRGEGAQPGPGEETP